MKFFTVGYGGRAPAQFLELLTEAGVRTLVDVRSAPQRAYLGVYSKQSTPSSGIEGLLARAGIAYLPLDSLGNPYREHEDWRKRYARFLARSGKKHVAPLREVAQPFALLCAEKKFEDCHREQLAEFLLRQWPGAEVEHL